MSTHTNKNKSLYIARPKKNANINSTEEDIVFSNKLNGKPYIAYPKNENNKPAAASASVTLQEGMYVAYPTQEEAGEESVSSFSRIYKSENYLGLPERPGWSSKKGYTLSVYNSLIKNRWSISTFCQMFKLKVS